MTLPLVAPHDSCIACFKGDTTTGLATVGCDEWHAAALIAMDVPEDQATAFVEQQQGEVLTVRVCADCAAKIHMTVAPIAGGELPALREP